MLESQRHQMLLEVLAKHQFMRVGDLTRALAASEATVRRDINKLSAQHQFVKIRGGAQSLEHAGPGTVKKQLNSEPFSSSAEQNRAAKVAIAQRAVAMCNDGDSIIINGGSSTFMMGQFLRDRSLNIMTNSFVLATELAANTDNQITLPGGELYREQGIILSAFDDDTIQHYSAKIMFMGSPAINERGVMESDPLLIRSEQKLRRQAEKLVVLADSSKLGAHSHLLFCQLSDVDVVITNEGADEDMLTTLRRHGVEVIITTLTT